MKDIIKEIAIHKENPRRTGKKCYVIVNGDDLCRDEKTNNAIITAFRKGVVTSTSAFINLEGSVEQLIKIHRENPDLPIGLHLNLTAGTPVANQKDLESLTDCNGRFYDIGDVIKHLPSMNVQAVKKELNAQVELFVSSGVPLDHIDYHYHLPALFTPFFKIIREIALKYKVPVRNPLPASMYRLITLNGNGGGGSTAIKKLISFAVANPLKVVPVLKKIGREAIILQKDLMLAEGIKSTNWFIDSFYNNASVENFFSILEQLPEGLSEIVCHPGLDKELEVLIDEKVKNAFERLNIQLVSWDFINRKN